MATEFTNMIEAERGYQANSTRDQHRRPDDADAGPDGAGRVNSSDRRTPSAQVAASSEDAAPCHGAQPHRRERPTMITLHRLGHAGRGVPPQSRSDRDRRGEPGHGYHAHDRHQDRRRRASGSGRRRDPGRTASSVLSGALQQRRRKRARRSRTRSTRVGRRRACSSPSTAATRRTAAGTRPGPSSGGAAPPRSTIDRRYSSGSWPASHDPLARSRPRPPSPRAGALHVERW